MRDTGNEIMSFGGRLKAIAAARTEVEYPSGSGKTMPWYPRGEVDGKGKPDVLSDLPALLSDIHDHLLSRRPAPEGALMLLREVVEKRLGITFAELQDSLVIPRDCLFEDAMRAIDEAVNGLYLTFERLALAEPTVEAKNGKPTAPAANRETLTPGEAAYVAGWKLKTLQNAVSKAKRSGKEFDWVLRRGKKRGFVAHRQRFLKWLEARPRRRGRPPKSPFQSSNT